MFFLIGMTSNFPLSRQALDNVERLSSLLPFCSECELTLVMPADPAGIAGNSELLNKAIRWLLMQRHGGGWNSTQETAFIVYAIVDYLMNSKELDPDYDVRIFLNNQQVLEKHMTKEDIFKKEWNFEFPGSKLKPGANEVRIEKSGSGKVYVASHLTYYTNEEKIHPRENGFRVEKEYFKLEKYTRYSDDRIVGPRSGDKPARPAVAWA